jgi:hypothetical protein
MAVFWVVAPCSLVEVYQRFRGHFHLIALMMEGARSSETLVNFYRTTRRHNPEDSHLLLKKLIVAQLIKKFSAFSGTLRFITMFTRTRINLRHSSNLSTLVIIGHAGFTAL